VINIKLVIVFLVCNNFTKSFGRKAQHETCNFIIFCLHNFVIYTNLNVLFSQYNSDRWRAVLAKSTNYKHFFFIKTQPYVVALEFRSLHIFTKGTYSDIYIYCYDKGVLFFQEDDDDA
jgi:hypothetical protein